MGNSILDGEARQKGRITLFRDLLAQKDATRTGAENELLTVVLYGLWRLIIMDGPTPECSEIERTVASGL